MRIDSIFVYHVAMPLVYPFRTAYGNDDTIESVLVRMDSGGATGWGEGAPWRLPGYSPEWAAGAFGLVRDYLAPQVVGKDLSTPDQLQTAMSGIKGNYFAKGAVDTAWWDLDARLRGEPLWKALGGADPHVRVGADFGVMETIDALLAKIDEAIREGFPRVKLKFRPGWDLDMVAAVRGAFPNHTFHIDCNSAWTLDALPMFKRLDRFNLAMIEQPLAHDDLIDHATLARQIATPICLDESITSLERARKAIQTKACGYMNLKPGRVGGLTVAVKIHDLCLTSGIPCWVGGMLESAVGAQHCLALATLKNFTYPADVFPSARFYRKDLAQPELALSAAGCMTAPDAPGVGAVPDESELKRHTLASAQVRPE
jgi:o-succinylbenzoate synthase